MARTFGFNIDTGINSMNGKPVEGVASITGNDITVHAAHETSIAPTTPDVAPILGNEM